MWPGTHHWVYEEGWLDRFFSLLEKDKEIQLYTFSQFRKSFKAKGFVNVPHASYSEMMEWSGGRFYNFFDKYPESRYMRDRMWSVSRSLEKIPAKNGTLAALEKAKAALYRAQCNCSYWHGVFGGLYLHHLRSAVFENLIRAEGWLNGKNSHPSVTLERFGSQKRWVFRQKNIASYFDPNYGGAME